MEYFREGCTFCNNLQTISTHKLNVFIKCIRDAFFTTRTVYYLEEFFSKLQLCVICAQKLHMSYDLKKAYDEMCNRNLKPLSTKCYFCESKHCVLIDIDDDPIDFKRKMELFHNSVLIYHSFENLSACTKCLYNLYIWTETRNLLYSMLKVPDVSHTAAENKKERPKNLKILLNRISQGGNAKSLGVNDTVARDGIKKTYLKRKLKGFKIAKDILEFRKLSFGEYNIPHNDKMFESVPYVQILVNSQISSNTFNQPSQSEDSVVISDSEDEFVSPKNNLQENKKKPFKIKFSPSFSKRINFPEEAFVCVVCEKHFYVKCDFLLHLLKHQKVESLVVNVKRYNITKHMNDFVKQHEDKKSVAAKNINQLLIKWVGEKAANTFEESQEFDKDKQHIEATFDQTIIENSEKNVKKNSIACEDILNQNSVHKSDIRKDIQDCNLNEVNSVTKEKCDENNTQDKTIEHLQIQELVNISNSSKDDTKNLGNARNRKKSDVSLDVNENSDKHIKQCSELTDNREVIATEIQSSLKDVNNTHNESDNTSDSSTIVLIGDDLDETIVSDEEQNTNVIDIPVPQIISNDLEETNSVDKDSDDVQRTDKNEGTFPKEKIVESIITENEVDVVKDNTDGDNENHNKECKNKNLQSQSKNINDVDVIDTLISCQPLPSSSLHRVPPVMTHEDLLNILNSTIVNEENNDKQKLNESSCSNDVIDLCSDEINSKRKRTEDDNETPKRKRVRFAPEKEIVTPDRSVILFERVEETDDTCIEV